MTDEAVAAARPEADVEIAAPRPPQAVRRRFHRALRRPGNWYELVRFATVGASGYVVNLAVFALLVHAAALDYKLAAAAAFCVALTNNFIWNRHWTFKAHDGHAGFQAARFFVVSLAAFGLNLLVLYGLVEGLSMPEVPAQAAAIAAATPLNFLGNKLWSFRT
jgi:dolichol-phosphate mannosyltransferase